MPYVVVTAKGSKVVPVSAHSTRREAVSAMGRVSGKVAAVQSPSGRIIASNVARSF